jgi:2-keto-4-pentenoate hydratase/2-oxohepta-3-ene-1,7-dioic acid hydratase in catechol pathway
MKLIRFGDSGREKPGLILPEGTRVDVSAFGEDYNETFFATDGLIRLGEWLRDYAGKAPRISDTLRLGSPIARPSKIVCVGLNYRDHAEETGAKIPAEPILFFKSTTALCGPNDDVVIPKTAVKPTGRWNWPW